jgi:hypothetical protein
MASARREIKTGILYSSRPGGRFDVDHSLINHVSLAIRLHQSHDAPTLAVPFQ